MKKDLRAKRSSQIATGIVAVLTGILAACSDAAAPSTAPHSVDPAVEQALANASAMAATIPESFVTQGLLRDTPLLNGITVTRVVGPEGGVIDIPDAGVQLYIPRGAVAEPMAVAITALPGAAVAYDLQPRGGTFLLPLRLVQRLSSTNLRSDVLASNADSNVGLVGFNDPSMIDGTTGIGVATDSLPSQRVTMRSDNLSFSIRRFSGYMASMGRD